MSASTPTPLRIDINAVAPALYRAQVHMDTAVRRSGLDPVLYELIKIRASQLNGCGYCLDMHTQDARAAGETEQRLNLLVAWRDAPFYSDREQAALALTEAITLISADHVPAAVWDRAAALFTEEELSAVIMGIVVINAWNRIAITSGSQAGRYVLGEHG